MCPTASFVVTVADSAPDSRSRMFSTAKVGSLGLARLVKYTKSISILGGPSHATSEW